MGGRFVQWRKFANIDLARNCPLCGKDIEVRTYPEEVAIRVLAILAVIAAGYWAHEHSGGYVAILLAVAVTLASAYLVVSMRLKDRQRFQKRRRLD